MDSKTLTSLEQKYFPLGKTEKQKKILALSVIGVHINELRRQDLDKIAKEMEVVGIIYSHGLYGSDTYHIYGQYQEEGDKFLEELKNAKA